MKILIVTPQCPYPPEKDGGAHALFGILSGLLEHNVDLIYFEERDRVAERALQRFCEEIQFVPFRHRDKKIDRFVSLLRGVPYAQYRLKPAAEISFEGYDVVILNQLTASQLASKKYATHQVAFLVDSMPLYFARKAAMSKSCISQLYYKIQSYLARKAEGKLLNAVDSVAYVSKTDEEYANTIHPGHEKCFFSIDMGVDEVVNLSPKPIGRSIVFTGIMDYGPNEDAALFFANEVYPAIKKQVKDVKFYIVGKNPTRRILDLTQSYKDIYVTGYVDNVLPYILGCTVYVSPLRYGSGVKNKVLEAMKCEKAAVFSPVSVEGIPEVAEGENCLIAANTIEWISKVIMLLTDNKARKLIEGNLTQSGIGERNWTSAANDLIRGAENNEDNVYL